MQVCLNGKFVPANKAKVSVFDPGFTSGEGIFETLLVKNGQPQFLREHITRLWRGAKLLGIRAALTKYKIDPIIKKLLAKNKLKNCVLRLTLTPQTFLLATRELPRYPQTAKTCLITMERCLLAIKSLNYLPNVLAQREAEQKGFDEALLVDRTGFVNEGGRSNFFWVNNGKVFTPPIGDALPGITRTKVISLVKKLKLKFIEKRTKTTELKKADEIFITSAVKEIWPVTQIERRRLGVGLITKQLITAYRKKYD